MTGIDLSAWNRLGREHCAEMSARLRAFHEGRAEEVKLDPDPRPPELAEAVLEEVRRLNREGRWRQARAQFDPAHEPFIPSLESRGRNLPCAIIVGPDTFLVRLGTAYEGGDMLRIDGDTVRPLPGLLAAAISADRSVLLIATACGLEIRPELHRAAISRLPWPGAWRDRVDHLAISNDGRTIAIADDELGVWVGRVGGPDEGWTNVHPDAQMIADEEAEYPGEEVSWNDSMTHCGLSADGRFVGYGSQCFGHYLDRIDPAGVISRHAFVDPASSYPHNACLSPDGRFVAFNSCHLYAGATLALPTDRIRDQKIAADSPLGRMINPYLRVYASTWLAEDAVGEPPGGFALAGAGFMSGVTPDGKLLFEQEFGSSASALDYCPVSRRLLLSSYSGFLHVYDVGSVEAPDRVIGVDARRELYRWVLWKGFEPFRW